MNNEGQACAFNNSTISQTLLPKEHYTIFAETLKHEEISSFRGRGLLQLLLCSYVQMIPAQVERCRHRRGAVYRAYRCICRENNQFPFR